MSSAHQADGDFESKEATAVLPSRESPEARRIRVAVASDQPLIAEAVRAALVDRWYDAAVVRWPASGPTLVVSGGTAAPRVRASAAARPGPDVLLILSQLDRSEKIATAQRLIEGLKVPAVVLTEAAPGPAWGAVLESGARHVATTATTLDEVSRLLDDEEGSPDPLTGSQVDQLIHAWREFTARREDLAVRMQTLSKREEQVLGLLHEGETVKSIAVEFGVTEATVRSQVKSMLRKLDVSSQIAAVAAYELLGR